MIDVFENADALARAAAELFVVQALRAVSANGRFSVLLAGGETPRRTYHYLAQEPFRSQVPWAKSHFFWGDERCVPGDDSRNNALLARTALLDRVPVKPEHIHPIASTLLPQQAADAYQQELSAFFAGTVPRFDLVLLGLGDDGHTASLLPGSVALSERERWTAIARRPEEPFSRVTLTAPILNQAALVLFLVSGGGKAAVVREILQGGAEDPPYPARLIQPLSGNVRWFVDQAAAELLNGIGK